MIYIKRYFNWATLGVFVFAAMVVATVATGVYAYKVHQDNVVNTELSKRMMAEEMAEKVNSAVELEKKRCGVRGIAKLYIEKHPNVITEQHKADLTKHEEIMLATMSHDEFDASNGVVNGIIEELKVLQQEYDAEQQRIKEEEERKAREAEKAKKQMEQTQNVQQYPSGGGNIDLRSAGVVNWGGYRFTWYSQNVLPGGGLNIPGRHVNGAGFVCDGDGYIVAATAFGRGTTGNSPWGAWKSYDTGVSGNTVDLYTSW